MKLFSSRRNVQGILALLPFVTTITMLLHEMPAAEAKDVMADFEVDIDSGSLADQQFTGSLSYDDSTLLNSGFEVAELSSFSFDFDGTNFSLLDAFNPFPEIELWDGEITGIFYVSDRFSFEIDFFGEQFFAYVGDPASGGDGFGDVEFALVSAPPVGVPEPSMALAFIPSLLVLGWFSSGKKLFS